MNKKEPNFVNIGYKIGFFVLRTLIIKFYCGLDGTRTRDPMRDRHVF